MSRANQALSHVMKIVDYDTICSPASLINDKSLYADVVMMLEAVKERLVDSQS